MDRIRVPVRTYRGSNPKKREDARRKALLAHKIEDYLNRRWDEHEEGYLVIMYHEIALDLGEKFGGSQRGSFLSSGRG